MRLLLIEDSELLQERVLESLAELAPNVVPHTAQTQDDAIRLIGQHPYDLVIADIELAQGNGLDVIRYARASAAQSYAGVRGVEQPHAFSLQKNSTAIGCAAFF